MTTNRHARHRAIIASYDHPPSDRILHPPVRHSGWHHQSIRCIRAAASIATARSLARLISIVRPFTRRSRGIAIRRFSAIPSICNSKWSACCRCIERTTGRIEGGISATPMTNPTVQDVRPVRREWVRVYVSGTERWRSMGEGAYRVAATKSNFANVMRDYDK